MTTKKTADMSGDDLDKVLEGAAKPRTKARESNEDVAADVERVQQGSIERKEAREAKMIERMAKARGDAISRLHDAAAEGREIDFAEIGAEITAEYLEAERAAIEAAQAIDPERFIFLLKCPHCDGPGIFFTKNPIVSPLIAEGEWFSAYKRAEEGWSQQFVPCQSCLMKKNTPYGLPVTFVPNTDPMKARNVFHLDGAAMRRVYVYHREEKVERAAIETEQRRVSREDLETLTNA